MTAKEHSEPTAQALHVAVAAQGQFPIPCGDGAPERREEALHGSPKIPAGKTTFHAEHSSQHGSALLYGGDLQK